MPSCFVFENGNLLGSAHTRSCRTSAVAAGTEISNEKAIASLRKGEYIQHPPSIGVVRQIFHCANESERGRFVTRIKSTRYDGSRPSSNARQNRDVLLAIWPFIGCGLTNDSGTGFKLPELRSAMRIDSFKPSVERAIEHNVTGGGH